MTAIPFTKMVGTGNDFIIVDTLRHRLPSLQRRWQTLSKTLCDRRRGVGADGLLVLEPSNVAQVEMRVFNPDGSEAEMCGNGARCVALYLKNGAREKSVTIETMAGVLSASVRGNRVAMRMIDPTELQLGLSLTVEGRRWPYGFVNTGVPHAVVPVGRLDTIEVHRLGRAIRSHHRFAPRGTNVNFIQPVRRLKDHLHVRTYERGVEEETLACGTGVVASAIVHALAHRFAQRQVVHVHVRSGDVLTVSFDAGPSERTPRLTHVVLEGPATHVFDGTVNWRTGNSQ